jgi:para-aminobenzoate synthetase/4-amino-4-deoxychorismate lyase
LWHLVSRVRGTLRADANDGDLLRATFPPGSVTGAPKVQAMHVIAELERTGREAYTGSLGYVSPIAGLELNVAIRTLELSHGRLWFGAGGGIVADSDPQQELEEALVKARPIAAAIGSSVSVAMGSAEPVAIGSPASVARRPAADAIASRGSAAAPRVSRRDPRPDPALGVFETMLVRSGAVQALDLHLQRLSQAVTELYGEAIPADLAGRVAGAAAAAGGSGDQRLRVRAVPGTDAVSIEIDMEPLVLPDPAAPVQLRPLVLPGGLGAHKWCDRRLIDRHGKSRVPLIIDREEQILEAAWANVWIVEGRTIATPPADGRLLPGITRALLLELAPGLGLRTTIEPISLERARRADAIFLTSSLRHAVPAVLGGTRAGHGGDCAILAEDAIAPDTGTAAKTTIAADTATAADTQTAADTATAADTETAADTQIAADTATAVDIPIAAEDVIAIARAGLSKA